MALFFLPLYPLVRIKIFEKSLFKSFLNLIENGVLPAPPKTKLPTQITGIFIFISFLSLLEKK